MTKNEDLLFQSQTINTSNTIIWNNNNINGNININNNYSNINPLKRSGSITFKNSYNKNEMSSPIISPTSSNFKKIKLGQNGNKSKPKINDFNTNNHYGPKTEENQLEMSHAKNYINYLHEHLDTSYNANNELNNKTEKIINMTKDIESEIKKNNDIYKSLILSYNDKLKANNKFKNEFINFLNQYKKQFKSISSEINNNKNEFDELNKKNLALKNEIKDTEDIISYLKKTEDILQNNALSRYKEEVGYLKGKAKIKGDNEIRILNKEMNKLIEIKNIGNKEVENLSLRNTKLKEEINKLENQLKNNKKNSDEISMGGFSLNDKKIRNKKFILDNNKKYKSNTNNEYFKQLIIAENNKTKDILKQIYSILKTKVEEKEMEKEKEKEKEEKKQKKSKENSITENEGKIKNGKKRNHKKKNKEIQIDNDLDYDNVEEEEIIQKKIIISKSRNQTEEHLSSTLVAKSNSKINQNIPMSQTFYKNNHKMIPKKENESENDEIDKEKENETEIERDKEKEIENIKNKKGKKEKKEKNTKKEKNAKKEKKIKFKDEKEEREEEEEEKEEEEEEKKEEKTKKKKATKRKSKEESKSNDKDKEKDTSKEKSLDKSKKENDKSSNNKDKDKSKLKNKSKDNVKAKKESKEKKPKSKIEKGNELSAVSDRSKKSKLFSHATHNSLSMDELSSIISNNTQKKLSQSQESIIDILTDTLKGSFLYTITNKGKLLSFNIDHKKFALVDSSIIDGWTSFVPNYLKNIEGSLLLNTLEGLFVITGPNHNELYFYSQEKNLIAQIISFKVSHKYGGLLLSPSPDNTLFAIGGQNQNNEVEHFSFDNDSCKSLPNLSTRRVHASYTFINSKLYAIFGENNNTIEYLNIKKLKNKWTKIDFRMDDDNLSKDKYINNIHKHVSLPVGDNNILIVGGKNNKKMMVLDLEENTLDVTDMKIPFIDVVGEYLFEKEKFFNETVDEEKKGKDGKNIKQLIGMDTFGNVHLFDYNFNYVVLLIKNLGKEK